MTVQRDAIPAKGTQAEGVVWLQFGVPIEIRNTGKTVVSFQSCMSTIEERVDDHWHAVWTPYCALTSAAATDIQPGEAKQFSVEVAGVLSGPGGPRWDSSSITGTHRYVATLTSAGAPPAAVTSNTFVLLPAP
ncbi:MAG: hypothetical protein ABJE10_08595 [bacterium]